MILVTSMVGLNALAYMHAHAMMHFTTGTTRTGEPETLSLGQKAKTLICGISLPRPRSREAPAILAPECRAITINVTNNIKLGAWYCPGSPQGSLVILFHGYGGEKTGTLLEAKAFLQLGASVLLVDFRGSGDSSESYTTVGYEEAFDVAAAVRYARTQLNASKVILYGQSMGAAAVLRAIHNLDVRPDGIIVEAVFDKLLNTVRHRFEAMRVPSFPSAQLLVFWGGHQAGFDGFSHNPVDYARSVACPILFLHGADDPRARVEEARRVFDAVPGEKSFYKFPGVGHKAGIVQFHEQWCEAVKRLLQRVGG
jgi:pimeloyl-ACP methyl ester carboxylesterase